MHCFYFYGMMMQYEFYKEIILPKYQALFTKESPTK